MSLESRIAAFDVLSSRFACRRTTKLILAYDIPPEKFTKLLCSVRNFLCRGLPGRELISTDEELLTAYLEKWNQIRNITPNGMIVPKRTSILEYNILVRTFAEIVHDLNFSEFISSWHVPLNVRIKKGEADSYNLSRRHPTEAIHSDSWAGESAQSVTVHIPLFGDTKRNHLSLFDPPPDFKEEWLGPRRSYYDGSEVAKNYIPLNYVPKNGELILLDFATLHSSERLPGAGARVSIDTTFALKNPAFKGKEVIHPWRLGERASHEVLLGLGETYLFHFPDREEDRVDVGEGFKHPANLKIVSLDETVIKKAVA